MILKEIKTQRGFCANTQNARPIKMWLTLTFFFNSACYVSNQWPFASRTNFKTMWGLNTLASLYNISAPTVKKRILDRTDHWNHDFQEPGSCLNYNMGRASQVLYYIYVKVGLNFWRFLNCSPARKRPSTTNRAAKQKRWKRKKTAEWSEPTWRGWW